MVHKAEMKPEKGRDVTVHEIFIKYLLLMGGMEVRPSTVCARTVCH